MDVETKHLAERRVGLISFLSGITAAGALTRLVRHNSSLLHCRNYKKHKYKQNSKAVYEAPHSLHRTAAAIRHPWRIVSIFTEL